MMGSYRFLINCLVLLLFGLLPVSTDSKAAPPRQIRVLSYNIHHGEGVDGKLDLVRIAHVIRSVDPTFVALQEVDRRTTRTNQVDQPAELAHLTGMQVIFEKNIEFEGGEYGNAVLSKLPVFRHRNHLLPSLDGGEQRGALCVESQLDQQPLVLVNTHFDHRSGNRERLASAKIINQLVAQYGDTPVILAGDLNAVRSSATVALLQRNWTPVSPQEQPTVPVTEPARQIDYIMVRPQSRWRVVESRVLDESVASDHRPILAVLELMPRPQAARKTLLTIEPTVEQPRNSEGDIIELADGRLCLIYTRFTGGTADHAAADLAMRISADQGQTWSEDQIVVRRAEGCNVMSVSLLRLADGRIALFYALKQSLQDCRSLMRLSIDETPRFGPATECITDEVGYYVLNNDRVVQLDSGRLVMPVAQHYRPGLEKPDWAGLIMCYLSDDAGSTWRRSQTVLNRPEPGVRRTTVQEPGVVQLRDGRLMMFCRTNAGSQYVAYSEDEGETWSQLQPSTLPSPLSPATIERIPWSGKLLCVWNDHSGRHPFPGGKRTPLCAAVSSDEGQTWTPSKILEADPDGWYCYTAMAFIGDRLLLAYCAGDSQVGGLNRLKVVSLAKNWLDEMGTPLRSIPDEIEER
jgi:endonuclease/exonuclease/phosphatase family metal-dependent hydrolase